MLDVSRSGYHAFRRRKPSLRAQANATLSEKIKTIYTENKQRYGSPRIHVELCTQGFVCGKHRVARLMKKQGIKAKAARREKFNPFIHYAYPAGKNLLERKFNAKQINRVWVSDITYIPTNEGWLYLAVILDACSRRVVGYSMSMDQREDLVVQGIEQAVLIRKPEKGLLFHSDRGIQTELVNGTTYQSRDEARRSLF